MAKTPGSGDDRSSVDNSSNEGQKQLEPFEPQYARKIIRQILETGTVSFTGHCRKELEKDDRSTVDCTNALRAGAVQPSEWENGSWRYRVETGRVTVIVQFVSEDSLIVITAWRTS